MRSLALFFFTIILRCSSAFVSHSFGQPFKFHPTTHAPLLLANGMKGVCNVPRRKTGPPSFCPLRMDSGSEGGGNFVLRYLDDIILYLDSKGGYVISESQLKSGLRNQDIADMHAAFDPPKRQPSPLSVTFLHHCAPFNSMALGRRPTAMRHSSAFVSSAIRHPRN